MRAKVLSLLLVLALFTGFAVGYYSSLQRVSYSVISVGEVEELVTKIAKELTAIRGLDFKQLPDVIIVNSSTVIATWGSEVPSEVVIFGEVLKMTLLAPKDYNISKSYLGLLGMWIAASLGNSIYVVSDNLRIDDPTVNRVIAHELMHVLQYQHFTLPAPKTLDESLALRSLVEGDADVVADSYVELKGFKGVSKISKIIFDDPYISIQVIPYVFGSNFINKLREVGGWELVNNAYRDPPRSMKYVMFPEKYLSKETMIEVTNDVSCDVVYEDVLGPSYIYVMISKYLDEFTASELSSLLVGDKVTYCSSGELHWRMKWVSEEAAREFREALTAVAGLRGGVLVDDKLYVEELIIKIHVYGDEVVLESHALSSA